MVKVTTCIENRAFAVENTITGAGYYGGEFEYNSISYKDGIVDFLQEYLMLEDTEAEYVAKQLDLWHELLILQGENIEY